ncbi:hypothetical protein JG559_04510 [Enterococcus faecalis]|uniref:Uncharacterized protein n=1 Tax=Enterococcus faecalis TaxID=1351 RepID=A0A974NZC3_ENTFL|nr:hypothetical protein JG559_04510 [Enterococcus faecalis]
MGCYCRLAGTIKVGGKELNEANVWDIRRMVGMVFQNPDNQFVGSTVEDDVAFGFRKIKVFRVMKWSNVFTMH